MLDAQIRARQEATEEPTEDVPDSWVDAMETMAPAARETYRDLLNTDGFVSYFGQATPISVVENLNLGSRPASRSGERTVEDLRAIPWVFSWTQTRLILPGWYSLASESTPTLTRSARRRASRRSKRCTRVAVLPHDA